VYYNTLISKISAHEDSIYIFGGYNLDGYLGGEISEVTIGENAKRSRFFNQAGLDSKDLFVNPRYGQVRHLIHQNSYGKFL